MAKRGTKAERTEAERAAAQDDEVYATLGALLGTLEVVASDDQHPVAPVQQERLRSALRLGHRLGQHLDALLLLAADEPESRLKRNQRALRPLVEHALRGALRELERERVTLSLPDPDAYADLRVHVDASRLDRMLSALAEALVAKVGLEGEITVTIDRGEREVSLSLVGVAASQRADVRRPPPNEHALLERAARRLLSLHGGTLRFDLEQAAVQLTLPLWEGP